VFNESSIQNRLVAGATVLIVFIVVLAIVATVLVLRTKNQDDLDKKTSNHLPLPLDYASNEGLCTVLEQMKILSLFFFIISHKIPP
jgi:preprotein translocase subunit SecY